MADDEWKTEMYKRLGNAEGELVKIRAEMGSIRTQSAVDQVRWKNVEEGVGDIKNTLSRLVWLIISALVTALLVFMLGGGLVL